MPFKSDRQRRAAFANMNSGKQGINTNSKVINSNPEIKARKTVVRGNVITSTSASPELIGKSIKDIPIAVGISKKNISKVKSDLKKQGYKGISAQKTNGFFTVFYRTFKRKEGRLRDIGQKRLSRKKFLELKSKQKPQFEGRKINNSFLKRLKQEPNDKLLLKAQAFKIQNRVSDSPVTRSQSFQTNFNTILFELKRRGLLRN